MNELVLPPAGEWIPRASGWLFVQVESGVGYWLRPGGARELTAGSVLIVTRTPACALRASQLEKVLLATFTLNVEWLTGVLSVGELKTLERLADQEPDTGRILEPSAPLSEQLKLLRKRDSIPDIHSRLKLLKLIFELFRDGLHAAPSTPPAAADGRARFRQLIGQFVAAEFLNLSFTDLLPKTNVSSRQLARLFREEVGVSFREKQTQLRLATARQLLATSAAKLSDVAQASGYRTYSLLNLAFKKSFGLSPGAWRQEQFRRNRGPRNTEVRFQFDSR